MNNTTSQKSGQRTKPALTGENYADLAEKVIKNLKTDKNDPNKTRSMLTTSQIRNLLAMTTDIYNDVQNIQGTKLDEKIVERINYLRVRFAYEAGRDPKVGEFVKEAHIIRYIKLIHDKNAYILFSRYMEALVAYHRYYGGKDQ